MCQEFRSVFKPDRPKEDVMVSSREGTCQNVVPVAPNGKFKEVNQTTGGRSAREFCAQSVLVAELTEGDVALLVVVWGVNEISRISIWA